MRRLALVLAVGLAPPLLAGCPTSPAPEATHEVRWELRDVNGNAATCATAPVVATVDVIVDGAYAAQDVPCAAGATVLSGLPGGNHRVTVEVRAAAPADTLVYRDWYDVTTGDTGDTSHTATPGRGTLRVAYTTSTGNCWETSDPLRQGGYIWFRLLDKAYGSTWAGVTEASSDADKQFYACGDYVTEPTTFRPLLFNVPFGVYTLKWIKDVRFPLSPPPTRTDMFLDCTPADVEIKSATFKDLIVTMDEVSATTPACPN